MNKEILVEKIKYLSSMPHSSLVEHCIYLEQENDNYKAQKYITDFISENGIIYEKNKQIQELTNNWNELEEWLKSVVEYETLHKGNYMTVRGEWGQEVLDKMKEIKEGK
jgi:uncharacterized protein YaaR (DUF327 family)